MGLGSRNASAHNTRVMRRHSVRSEDFADYSVDQRVRTRDGIGRVEAVEDGPFPGTEQYRVVLEGGLGGGLYSTREILGAAGSTQASVERTAADDYPELAAILVDRPDIARNA